MVDIIEGEAVEVESRAVVVAPDHGMTATGPLALAGLSDDEFDRRLAALDTMRTRVARMQRALMVLDVDYGTIPGTPKPTLLKPGAEKLCQAYGLAADFTPERITGDGVTAPALAYQTRCQLHLGSLDGQVVAVGYGSANSWERKHRYRNAELACPECGNTAGTVKRSKKEPGWYCWAKIGGCGATFRPDDTRVRDQVVGQVDNPDPWDLDTTLLKMAEKRAFVDATLRATAASGLFTQDVEDLPRDPRTEPEAPEPERPTRHEDGLNGTAEVGKGDADFELRQTPDGYRLAFKVMQGRKGYKVIATGDLAGALATLRPSIEGQRVTVWGTFHDETFTPKPKGDEMPRPVTYQVVHLERIATPDGVLPAPQPPAGNEEPRPEAPSQPMFDDAEQAAIDAALESIA